MDYHDCVYLEDIGPEAFKFLGMEQLKQWSDPSQSFTISLKYGAPIFGIRLPLIVTSNYTIEQLMEPDQRYSRTELDALMRRFEMIKVEDLFEREKIELKTKEELKQLKKEKNADFSLCFIQK